MSTIVVKNLTIEELGTFQLFMQRIKRKILKEKIHLFPIYEAVWKKIEEAKKNGMMEITQEERIFMEMIMINVLDKRDKDDPVYQKIKAMREKLKMGG